MALSPGILAAFGGIRQAKSLVDSVYFSEGVYWVIINHCKELNNRNQDPGLVIETTVVRVVQEVPAKSLQVGQSPAHILKNVGEQRNYFLPEVKRFAAIMFDEREENITEAEAIQVFDPATDVCRDMCAEIDVRLVLKKNKQPHDDKAYFTRHNWKRQVPPSQVIAALPPDQIERFWPNGKLVQMMQNLKVAGLPH